MSEKLSDPVSPTEIEDALLCWRRWGWRKLDKIKLASNASAQFGIEAHGQFDRWFQTGVRPDADTDVGRAAESALHLWPNPQIVPNNAVEFWISVSVDGVEYRGKQDIECWADPAEEITGQKCGYTVPVVGDHKFTSHFKWAKDEKKLLEDPQAMIYAAAAMVRHDVNEVILRWVYVRKRKPKPHPVRVVVGKEHVLSFMSRLNPFVREMNRLKRTKLKALDLPPDATACSAYNGCAYASLCKLSDMQKIEALIRQRSLAEKLGKGDEEMTMTLNEKMTARLKQTSAINPPESDRIAEATPTPAPVALAAPAPSGSSLMDRLGAKPALGAPNLPPGRPAEKAPEQLTLPTPSPVVLAPSSVATPPPAPPAALITTLNTPAPVATHAPATVVQMPKREPTAAKTTSNDIRSERMEIVSELLKASAFSHGAGDLSLAAAYATAAHMVMERFNG